MSLARILSSASLGLSAPQVVVEVHLLPGLPALTVVGLPEAGVRESKDRVRSAIINSGFEFPSQRITINLSPAELPKRGGRYDLAIALGILVASGQLPANALENVVCLGELSLSGAVHGTSSVLTDSLTAIERGQTLLVSPDDADEAALPDQARVYAVSSLREAADLIIAKLTNATTWPATRELHEVLPTLHDLCFVQGQSLAKRALEIAAAGGHSLLMSGPPGAGKTQLANCLMGILPTLNWPQFMESLALHSLKGEPRPRSLQPTLRNPHHSASRAAMIGGGSEIPSPGEISLAHHGVLFLDEMPEFDRHVLESLREPLENGMIAITRSRHRISYPAQFQLIATMNPCPCGHHGDALKPCQCTPDQVQRYRQKLSGPLLDRIDMRLSIGRPPAGSLHNGSLAEPSIDVRDRVVRARAIQLQRSGYCNARLDAKALSTVCALDHEGQRFMQQAETRLQLSPRAFFRVLRVARTISDLADAPTIKLAHLQEALMFRGEF